MESQVGPAAMMTMMMMTTTSIGWAQKKTGHGIRLSWFGLWTVCCAFDTVSFFLIPLVQKVLPN